ncbi:MAG: c-type cytochrome [Woeseiaceae bacterium]|nr:c-type cytochrome [Woeseiaceae bacterium]
MRKFELWAGIVAIALATAACGPQPPEFALPEGDVKKGQELFISFNCTTCHTVRDLDLPEPESKGPVSISLGGRVSKLKSYPELVTSVINPSHQLVKRRRAEEVSQDGESLMTVYNDIMTVSNLVDIVAFLESRYEEFERPKVRYTLHPH